MSILMGITTYLKWLFSGMVISAELFASASSIFTMSCSMLVSASIRYVTLNPISIASPP